MSRRRSLRPEEEELWQAVARTAKPLKPAKARPVMSEPKPALAPPPERPAPLPAFRLGEQAHGRDTGISVPAATPLRMDAKAFSRMTKGKLAPEARIDLHGLTLAEAHPVLTGFILRSHAACHRLVLVITGKGRPGQDDGPIPRRPGILRQQVPLWLRQAPLSGVVQQVAEAHVRHGGGGALYVYLRRPG